MHAFSRLQFLGILLLAGLFGQNALSKNAAASEALEDLRLRHRFGVGFSAGGPLSLMGLEIDINITEEFSLSGGYGTGIDYSTMMIKGRYFLLGERVSPYLALALGRWWTRGTTEREPGPSILRNQFLSPGYDYTKGFDVVFLSPALGAQYLHPIGMSLFAELQYLVRVFNLSGGVFAGAGMHWYF